MPSLEDLKNAQVFPTDERSEQNTVNITDPNFVPENSATTSTNTVDVTGDKPSFSPSGGVVPVDIADIAPYRGPATRAPTILDEQFDMLNIAIERNKKDIDRCVDEAAAMVEANIEAEKEHDQQDAIEQDEAESNNSAFDDIASDGFVPKKKIIIPEKIQPKETIKIMNENDVTPTSNDVVDDVHIDDSTKSDKLDLNTSTVKNNDFASALDVNDDEFFKDFDDEDKKDLDEDEAKNLEKQQIEMAKKAVSGKIKPIHEDKIVDLASFTISQKPISITKALQREATPILKKADWILWTAKRSFSMSELSGPEIEKMDIRNTNRNRINALKDLYRVFYDHIIDANKAPTFEAWLKVTPFLDVQHLYFAAYMASFGPENAVPYTCTDDDCNEVFIQNVPFGKMVSYKDDDVKHKAEILLNTDTTSQTDEYEVQLLQVSDEFVVGLKTPSIFNVVFETAALPEADSTKYADLLSVISYIDNVYVINRGTNGLDPVDTRPDHNNATKTVRNKVKAYYTILKKLTSDQYYNLAGHIKNIQDPAADITYKMPEVTCPKCGKLIPEVPQSASDLLFTRHQLVAINSI